MCVHAWITTNQTLHPLLDQTFLATGEKQVNTDGVETEIGEVNDPSRREDDLAGHLHGLWSALVVVDGATGGALHLWAGGRTAA